MIARKKGKKASDKSRFDPVKDRVFKKLAAILEIKGFKVRREELKAGPGWRASSGSCRAKAERLIFVERRLPQDEQLNFLLSTALDLGLNFETSEVAELPEATQHVLLKQGSESQLAA